MKKMKFKKINQKLNKKSQVTVFIIIGIVLLFSTALIFYIKQQVEKYEPAIGLVQEVPLEVQPIHAYITGCLNSLAEEALIKAGLQGGYVDTTSLYANELNPTEGEAVTLSSGSDLKIPYWFYLKSDNDCVGNCQFDTKRPSLEAVQFQIELYIKTKLGDCTNYLNDFRAQGFDIDEGDINVTVKFGKETHVLMNYPLKITKGTSVSNIDKFYVKIPVNFKEMYELASAITNVQIQYNFIEKQAINVISGFAGLEKEIPPIAATEFKVGASKMWLKQKVEENIKSLLLSYTPVLEIFGTKNFIERSFDDKYKSGVYGAMVLPIAKPDKRLFSDYSASFMYLNWPIYFNVKGRGSSGSVISAESTEGFDILSFIGIKRYNYYFDLSYPVLIELKDPDAMKGKGYKFMFALEANMRSNEPLNTTYQGLPMSPVRSSMFCNVNQRTSGNITINVKDAITGLAIKDATVIYSCGNIACNIGYTSSEGILTSKFPICGGGSIIISKKDYWSNPIKYNPMLGKSDFFNVSMYPYQEKKIIVKKMPIYKKCWDLNPPELLKLNIFSGEIEKDLKERVDEIYAGYLSKETQRVEETDYTCYWRLKEGTSPLLKNEMAVIQFERIKEDPNEKDYSTAAIQNGTEPAAALLIPGEYKVTITLVYNLPDINGNNVLKITSRKVTYTKGWPWDKEDLYIPENTQEFKDAFVEGGLQIDDSNKYWNLSADKLYNNEAIIFYSLYVPEFTVGSDGTLKDAGTGTNMRLEDLGQIGKIGEYTDLLRDILEPVYVKP